MSIPAGKEYIKRYFFPLSDGQHVQLEYDELDKPHYIIKDDKTIKSVYFNRLPKELYKSEQVSLTSDHETFKSHTIQSIRNKSADFEPLKIASDYLWSSQLENTSKLFSSLLLSRTE